MAEVARNVEEQQEYWRPLEVERRANELENTACPTCSTDYPVGARFCYVCGTSRDPIRGARTTGEGWSLSRILDLANIRSFTGLGVAPLVAFLVGIVCVIAAALTGYIYTASTLLDWQAVQLWRVEWLLASIAAFVAGALLKR